MKPYRPAPSDLRALRERNDLTQRGLAEVISQVIPCHQVTVARWETEVRPICPARAFVAATLLGEPWPLPA